MTVTVTAAELEGAHLPMVCARTGDPADEMAPVWFAGVPWWAWLPAGVVVVAVVATRTLAPVVSWWLLPALVLPVVASRAVAGVIPLDGAVMERLRALRRRRVRLLMSGLLLSWVAVGAWLLGARVGAVVVLAVVVGTYVAAVWTTVVGRLATVGGRAHRDGTVTLTRVHPRFAAALDASRAG